ncbi:unnamed protein product, partial [marine sediment metagenome]
PEGLGHGRDENMKSIFPFSVAIEFPVEGGVRICVRRLFAGGM